MIYSGNLISKWQVPDKLVEVFGLIRQGRPDAYFLILTPERHRELVEPHLKRAGIAPEDYGIYSCPHVEVVRYLCAADVALLLRKRHPANEVAAPGKFSECMLTGLSIIMTEGIGEFSDQVRDTEFACVLPGLDGLQAMQGRIQEFCARNRSSEQRLAQGRWAAQRVSTDLSMPQLAALYQGL
ncbi:MAG: hypothetical protein DMF49_12880 [Acidobacteria bacterium]|nr:MAG: hypothetical protein DMF49_12880 [Acidobacteriota bacterium]